MSERSVFGVILLDNFKEVLLVHNKPGQRGKPAGIGCPGGGRNGTENDLDTGHRETKEEAGLTQKDVEFFRVKDGKPHIPQNEEEEKQYDKPFIAYEEKSPDGHTKIFIIGRVFDRNVPLLKNGTDETTDCRWYPVNSLPQVQQKLTGRETSEEREKIKAMNAKRLYDGHFYALGKVLKLLRDMGENVPIMVVNQKASGRVHDKNRSEQPDFKGNRGGNKRGQYGRGNDFRREGRPNFARQSYAGQRREDRPEKPVGQVERHTFEE